MLILVLVFKVGRAALFTPSYLESGASRIKVASRVLW